MDGMTVNDMDLVREYARSRSEQAFAAIVSRHIHLVHSVALRQVGNPHLAEEITQTVFVVLSRKAGTLREGTVLSGWLCRTARYVSAKALTMRRRRADREQAAFMESSFNENHSSSTWAQIEPLLETGMGQLGRKDHDALVLRYFEGRNFKDVSSALGTTEAGAKMRVNRALEKLRAFFSKRGVTLTTALIAGAVSAHSVQAAPAALVGAVTLAAVKGTTLTTTTLTLTEITLKYMALIKLKTTATVGAIALLVAGTTAVTIQQTLAAPEAAEPASPAHAGYATPEATLKSLVAALAAADTKKFEAGCTPRKAEEFRNRNAARSEADLKREAAAQAKAFSKYKIDKAEKVSENEVLLHLTLESKSADGPPTRNPILRMQKIGNEWKYDGDRR